MKTGAPLPASVGQQDINTLVLPSKESLAAQVQCPGLDDKEAAELEILEDSLKKQLSEIDFRLSRNLHNKENIDLLKKSFTPPAYSGSQLSEMLDGYFTAGFLSGGACGIPAFFALNSFFNIQSPAGILLLPVCLIAGAFAGLFTGGFLGSIIKDPLGEVELVKKIIAGDKGSPPLASLPDLMNIRAAFKLGRYKGPQSDAAKEFDREITVIGKSSLTPFEQSQREQMARDALLITREQVNGQLEAATSKLNEWRKEKQLEAETKELEEHRQKSITEASSMLNTLIRKLEIPPHTDQAYLEEVSRKSLEMLDALKEMKKDSHYQIPEAMPALRYFASILSWLEKGQAAESVRSSFFEKLSQTLSSRLLAANRALGRATPGVDD